MAVEVHWVRYGREASQALRGAIVAAKGGDPLAPVTVVVPSNHVGVAARRLLASGALGPVCGAGPGLVAVTFLTPYRLAELLGAPRLAAAGRRPVSTPVIAAALRAALADAPGLFGPVAAHPATEQALVGAYRELRDLSPHALDQLAGHGRRAADVVRIHRAARARLEPSWYDEEDLTVAAVATLDAGQAPADLGTVVIHLPQRLSRHVASLLAATARAGAPTGDERTITVLAGHTGDARADEEVATSVTRLAGEASAPPTSDPLDGLVTAERTMIVTASDADDEVRAAVRAVVDAARAGTPLDRMALLYASPEPYARLAHEHLAAADLPANGAAVLPVAARVAGRCLLQLLALPTSGYRRQDVFTWLAAAPVRHDGRWAATSSWERLSRAAAVVSGRGDWDRLLAAHADELEADATRLAKDDDPPAWRLERLRDDATRTRALRDFTLGLIDDLDIAASGTRSWGEHARWARGLVERFLGGATRRADWPAAEARAAERLEVAIDRLAALDDVEGPVTLDVFTRTLTLELDGDLGRVGRFGEGVLVGGIDLGTGLDLDLVVVLGLAESTFPSAVRDDSLLPDHERGATLGELPLRRSQLERQHRQLLAALAAADHHVLGVPRGDLRRSTERVPSRWVLDIARHLADSNAIWSRDLFTGQWPWVRHVASFDGGLRHLDFPATEQEHRLRSLLAAAPDAAALSADTDPVLALAADVVTARRSRAFTRFDGNLAGLAVPSPLDGVTSPTGLERWAGCPFAYFVHDLLRVDAVENPEEQLRITPLDWGNLVHEALEEFIGEVLERPEADQPGPHQRWTAADHALLADIGAKLCDSYEQRGRVGRPIFWRRDRARILADLRRFLAEDDQVRTARGARPHAAELAFGFRGKGLDAVPLDLPDGRQVRFRGKADRVDIADDGSIHIVDYKTGSARSYERLSAEDPDKRGRKLQLAVYGVAARVHRAEPDAPVLAEYWFTSTRGDFKRIGYLVTPEVLERVGRTLGTIVGGIEAGAFPSHPTAVSTSPFKECDYCDVDNLGVTDLRRAWEHKRHDVALEPYAQLTEPLDGAPSIEEEGTRV